MKLLPSIAVLGAGLSATSCIVVPVTVEGYDTACRIVTHHMALKMVQLRAVSEPSSVCQGQGCGDLLVALGITATSAVVSGSIVVVGNVVYWAEQRADCQAQL